MDARCGGDARSVEGVDAALWCPERGQGAEISRSGLFFGTSSGAPCMCERLDELTIDSTYMVYGAKAKVQSQPIAPKIASPAATAQGSAAPADVPSFGLVQPPATAPDTSPASVPQEQNDNDETDERRKDNKDKSRKKKKKDKKDKKRKKKPKKQK